VLKLPKGYIYYLYLVYPHVMTGLTLSEWAVAKRFNKDASTIAKAINSFLNRLRNTPAVFMVLDELIKKVKPSIEAQVVEAKPEAKPTIEITVSEKGVTIEKAEEVTPPAPTPAPPAEETPPTPPTPQPEEVVEEEVEAEKPGIVESALEEFVEREMAREREIAEEFERRETGFELAKKVVEYIKKEGLDKARIEIRPVEVEVEKPSVEEVETAPPPTPPRKLTIDDLLRQFLEGLVPEVTEVMNRYFDLARKTLADECSGMDVGKCIENKLRERAGQVITLKTYLEHAKIPKAEDIAKLVILALGPRKTSNLIDEVKDALNLGLDVLDVLRDYTEEFEQMPIPRSLKNALINAIRVLIEYEKIEIPHEVTGNRIIRYWLRQLVDVLDALYELRGKLTIRDIVTRLGEVVREGFRTVFGKDLKTVTYEGEEEEEEM